MIRQDWSTLKKLMFLKAAAGGGSAAVERYANGNPVVFGTDLARPLKEMLINLLPVQSGSGDPSPQNIRPIVAWDGVKVWHGGKNLFNKDIEPYRTGMYISEVKNFMVGYTENANYNVYRIPVKPNTYYTFGLIKASTPMYAMLNEQGYVVNSGSNDGGTAGTYKTIITTSATKHLLLSVAVNGTYKCDDVLQLEEGQAHTEYEPITENDISFPSPVYGGTLDVVSGVLTVTHKAVDLGDVDWNLYNNTQNRQAWISPEAGITADIKRLSNSNLSFPGFCEILKNTSYSATWTPYCISTYLGQIYICVPSGEYASMSEIKEALKGNIMVYELATPQEITLTPEQITAIKGNNTIWSDANDAINLTYLVSGKYAEDHPVGGLGSGLGSGLLGAGTEPEEPIEDPADEPEE